MDTVTKIILNYRKFIENSWEQLLFSQNRIDDEDIRDDNYNDWLQANWEILVETVICKPGEEFLEVYGDGADCNGDSSRVAFPKKLPTHKICCKHLKKNKSFDLLTKTNVEINEFEFHSFVKFKNGEYNSSPPFNAVQLEYHGEQYIIDLSGLIFKKVIV